MNNETTNSNTQSRNRNDAPELSLVELLRVISRYKVLCIATGTLIIAASIAYAFLTTPVYRAETVLSPTRGGGGSGMAGLISQFGGSLGGIASMVGLGGGGSRGSRLIRGEALTIMTSRAYIQDFIKEENLLPILFADKWDAENEEWINESGDVADIPTLSDGYDLLTNEILTTSEDQVTGIVSLAVEWKDPILAAEWANKLVSLLNERMRAKSIKETDNMINYLNQELERTKVVELRQAIFYMIEQQIAERTGARVQDEFAFKIINPAIPSDPDKYVWPARPLIIGGGIGLAFLSSIFVAFVAFAFAHFRREYRGESANSAA